MLHDAVPTGLLPFLMASLLIELTPGPNMTWLAIVALVDGKMAGFKAVLGISAGLLVLGLLAAFGVAEIIKASALAYETLRWIGIGFLVWLAWDGWRGADSEEAGKIDKHYAQRGFFTNLFNPKAAIFYISVLPAFVDGASPTLGQTITFTIAYVLIAALVHSGIVVLAARAAPVLQHAASEKALRRTLSVALLGVAIWFAYATMRTKM